MFVWHLMNESSVNTLHCVEMCAYLSFELCKYSTFDSDTNDYSSHVGTIMHL